MSNIKNIVKVMNFHSLVRVDKAKRDANKYHGVEEELRKIIYQITNNVNLKLDKKIFLENKDGIILNVFIGNDLGFCGDFNYQLQKAIKTEVDSYKIIIGKKIFQFDKDDKVLLEIDKSNFSNEYHKVDEIVKKYIKENKIKELNILYNHYYNVNDIKFKKLKVFPVDIGTFDDVDLNSDFIIETDINELLSNILSLSICFQIKMLESNSFASENVMRQKITNESLDKIEKIEEEERIRLIKEKKSLSFKRQINNYKNSMR